MSKSIEDRLNALENRLKHVESQLELYQAVSTYGPAVDSLTLDLAASLWTEDGVYDIGDERFDMAGHAEIFNTLNADYHKDLVDDMSHGYFGNNAVRCMKLLSKGYTTDEIMDVLCERMGGAPRDNEDVMCDFVRFGQNYVPRSDSTFDHVPGDIMNNSGWESGWEQRQGKAPEKTPLETMFG